PGPLPFPLSPRSCRHGICPCCQASIARWRSSPPGMPASSVPAMRRIRRWRCVPARRRSRPVLRVSGRESSRRPDGQALPGLRAQLRRQAALALWWCHPLAWLAAGRVRRDAELAADDLVLRTGERPSVYSGHLLDIVRSLRAGRETVGAMAMARASGFESRLRALLEARRRGPASAAGRVAAVGLSSIALLLAAVHPTPARASEQACEAGAEVATPSSEPHFSVGKVRDAFANLGTSGFYQRGMALHREGRYPEAI